MAARRPPSQDVMASLIRCAEGLLEMLDVEHSTLIERNIEQLPGVLARKLDLSQELKQLNDELLRSPMFSRPATTEGGSPALMDGGGDWRRLQQLTERCDRANRFNGALIAAHEGQLRLAMAALKPSTETMYGRGGTASVQLSGRLSGHA